jgi:hypothetical protein
MSRATLKAIQAAAGNAGEATYVDDVFSTYLYDGTGTDAYPVQEIAVTGNSVTSATGLAFKSDGTKMYATSGNSAIPGILEFDLSTAWDVTTATYSQFGTTFDWCSDMWIDSTGTKVFVVSTESDHIGYYTLSTAWDISTISSRVASRSTTGEGETNPQFIFLKPDGTELYYGGTDTDNVFQLGLSTAFDLSTASHDATFSVATQEPLPFALLFNSSGTRMYITGNSSPRAFYQYNLSTAWELTTAFFNSSCATGQSIPVSGMHIADGKLFTVFSGANPPQYKAYSMSDPDRIASVARNVITNGIDLDGEGGLVWIKGRGPTAFNHILEDTARGADRYLRTNTTNGELVNGGGVTAFNSNGFGTGPNGAVTTSGEDYASWTFRKQPGFFDIVTYTGNATARTVSHNLGSVPGMIIIKCTSGTFSWAVWHRGINTDSRQYLWLNSTQAVATSADYWNTSDPTDSFFPLGTNGTVNSNGQTYVAYLFAHDAQDFGTDSDESIIKCGSYTGNGSTTGPVIDLGFEPQFIFAKNTTTAGYDWFIYDSMRGITAPSDSEPYLAPNLNSAESAPLDYCTPTATGFQVATNSLMFNKSGDNFIYVAIRRPHKPASKLTAADLFDTVLGQTSGTPNYNSSTGVVDALFRYNKNSDVGYPTLAGRLSAIRYMETSKAPSESLYPSSKNHFAVQNGWGDAIGGTSTNVGVHMFRRAPGFFDSVAYTGNASTRTINHSLGVTPEMMIIKCRTNTNGWSVYHSAVGNTGVVVLQSTGATITNSAFFNDTSPTDTVFTVGSGGAVNENNIPIISYLFATAPGISKVGSYTGTGSDVNVDCGFSSGSRFVLVKRTDSTGGWYLWDSENGITAGNDPYILLNSSAGQTTGTDYIDPLSSGFTITSSAPAELNASGGTYIFLAIA